jgi:hydrogenase maturation protein HypF
MQKTYKIFISGQVQGVGFRPYVYGLAREFSLVGTVSNNEEGVVIYVSGLEDSIFNFYNKLIQVPPPVSRIKDTEISKIEYKYFEEFKIIPSKKEGQLNLILTPDFAICKECQNDIVNPVNRRYNYPFATCVNCGPRWAITETFPFERSHTSMDNFPMCDACIKEYTNPLDRRFHSQTNTCETCGIDLCLIDNSNVKIETSRNTLFKEVAKFLSEGHIVAIKNTSGYLLCCNAENEKAVKRLRDKKNRPKKPFAILYPSLEFLKDELQLDEAHVKSLRSTERPITIMSLKGYKGNIALKEVAPGLNQLGVMLPYSGILQLLANELIFPIVATSGNIHGSPIISANNEAFEKLKNVADYFLQHNLKIIHPQDDSVVKYSEKYNAEVLLRRSRGFAPNYFNASITSDKKIMALGAHIKSSIGFFPNSFLYISQYIGNLDNYDVYERFTNTAKNFVDIFEQKPNVILIDSHPTYQSTLYGTELAQNYNSELHKIQHHKAHFASVLGEYDLFDSDESILGVVWDGTGFGEDRQIWGGEFFEYQSHKIDRISHFEYFNWLAGDKMSKEPKLSMLTLSNDKMQSILDEKFSSEELTIYQSINRKNKLKTSSVGRLFDAVASLLNICDKNTYEGEAAMLIENYILDYKLEDCESYCSKLKDGLVPTKELFYNLYVDYKKGNSKENVITNFLFTLASLVYQIADNHNIKTIAFSGGVFQNTTLIDMIKEIGEAKYKLYFNRDLSPNDENISFGQIMYYLNVK